MGNGSFKFHNQIKSLVERHIWKYKVWLELKIVTLCVTRAGPICIIFTPDLVFEEISGCVESEGNRMLITHFISVLLFKIFCALCGRGNESCVGRDIGMLKIWRAFYELHLYSKLPAGVGQYIPHFHSHCWVGKNIVISEVDAYFAF